MKDTMLFSKALNLSQPWYVERVEFREEKGENVLHIYIDHKAGFRFWVEQEYCPVYDHVERTWRHMNFFEHECYLHCRQPRVKTRSGQVLTVQPPWSNSASSFTLLFENNALRLVKAGMSCSGSSDFMKVESRVVSRIIHYRVAEALACQPLSEVEHLAVDETSYSKHHKYITVLTDKEQRKVVGLGLGKGKEAVEDSLVDMQIRGASVAKVKTISMDFSPAYIAACDQFMPQAKRVFDRFHLEAMLNKAVDEVRREDQKYNQQLKNTRYLWLHNFARLSQKKQRLVESLQMTCPRIGKAYRLKEQFKEIFYTSDKQEAIAQFNAWLHLAGKTNIEPIRRFVKLVRKHWRGIITYFDLRTTNAIAERINLKIQEIKRSARGFRNTNNFLNMIYFHLGGLDLGLFNTPTKYGE